MTTTPTKLRIVTGLFDLANGHRTVGEILANSKWVAEEAERHRLSVYVDSEIFYRANRMATATDFLVQSDGHVDLIPWVLPPPLDANLKLQANDNPRKVRHDYVALMQEKYRMIELACDDRDDKETTHVAWIDLGITHVALQPIEHVDIFERLPSKIRVHMLRYFDKVTHHGEFYLWHQINGLLAGGLVIGPRHRMRWLCERMQEYASEAARAGFAVLDEALLETVVRDFPESFEFSFGDYCDILQNHDQIRRFDHVNWMIRDARERGVGDAFARLFDRNAPAPQTTQAVESTGDPRLDELAAALRKRGVASWTSEDGADRFTFTPANPALQVPAQLVAEDAIHPTAAGYEEIGKAIAQELRDHEPRRLGLVMIVKNESSGITETLRSFKPYIQSWTILDTGSTDGTQDMIRAELTGIPGELHEEPFVDFSTSRNRALDLHRDAAHTTTFAIMPDSDDVLEQGDHLRALLELWRTETHPAYTLDMQRPGIPAYRLPVVTRVDAKPRYRMRVHEYLDAHVGGHCSAVLRQNRQNVENSSLRWERDLVWLKLDRAQHPTDPRVAFYLAQTYEQLGAPMHALRVYRERAIMPSSHHDETFETKLRIAKIMQDTDSPWAETLVAYLDAYRFDGSRAEPLFKIAEYYYGLELWSLCYLFAYQAAMMKPPSATLWVDIDVTWKADDLVAIAGYRLTGESREEGRLAAIRCLKARPSDERVRANWAFYAPSATERYHAHLHAIDVTPKPGWHASNPSIMAHQLGDGPRYLCIVRTTNYRIVNGQYLVDGKQANQETPIYTENHMLELDASFKTLGSFPMLDVSPNHHKRSSYPVHGYEDCRLFALNGRLFASATVCDFDLARADTGPREIVLLDLHTRAMPPATAVVAVQIEPTPYRIVEAQPIRGNWSDRAQKNWMPVPTHGPAGQFRWVYTACNDHGAPTLYPGKQLDHLDNVSHGRLRGGSQLVALRGGGYLAIVHDVVWSGGARMYLHRFIGFNSDIGAITGISDPFYFEKLGIEFCCGLAHDQFTGKLVASYSVDDSCAKLAEFGLGSVIDSLRKPHDPLFVI